MRKTFGLLLAIALSAAPLLAKAQPAPPEGWTLGLGAALISGKAYDGSDARQTNLFPNVSIGYQNKFFLSVRGAEYTFRPVEGLSIKPRISYSRGRSDDGEGSLFMIAGEDTDHIQGLGDTDPGFVLGGSVEYAILFLQLEGSFSEYLAADGGREASVGAKLRGRVMSLGPPIFWNFGPSVTFFDETRAQTLYSVTPAQSARSGLPVFEAEGGVFETAMSGALVLPTSQRSRLITTITRSEISDDFADSPVVTDRLSTSFNLIWAISFDFADLRL
ncbi:MAG: MipA/OmpV family protein [Pseudomonadota bacterium]